MTHLIFAPILAFSQLSCSTFFVACEYSHALFTFEFFFFVFSFFDTDIFVDLRLSVGSDRDVGPETSCCPGIGMNFSYFSYLVTVEFSVFDDSSFTCLPQWCHFRLCCFFIFSSFGQAFLLDYDSVLAPIVTWLLVDVRLPRGRVKNVLLACPSILKADLDQELRPRLRYRRGHTTIH